MDLPTFLDINNEDAQRAYQQELNQSLRAGVSNNGFTIPQVTNAQLTTNVVINPDTGASTTLAAMMPNGSLWFVTDTIPPCYVGKLSGSLVKFTTTAYP